MDDAETADRQFRRRVALLAAVLTAAMAAILLATAVFAVFRRGYYLEAGRRIALKSGIFHPVRGRIYDADGTLLAWSERHFDLLLASALPQDIPVDRILENTAKIIPGVESGPIEAEGTLLRADLTPQELSALKPTLTACRYLKVKQRIERIAVCDEAVRAILGCVRDGKGVSGLEQQHDRELAGTPGRYEVMLDRDRNWLNGTFRLLTAPRPGRDIQLTQTVKSMTEKADPEATHETF